MKATFVISFSAGAIHTYWSNYLSLVNHNGLCDSAFIIFTLLRCIVPVIVLILIFGSLCGARISQLFN